MIETTLKKMGFSFISVFIIAISIEVISFSIDIPYGDLMLFFDDSDYFWFDGRHICLLSSIPVFTYTIIMTATVPFTKDNKIPKIFHRSGNVLGLISMAVLFLFSALALIINFYLIFLSSYSICKEPPALSNYFANDPSVCKNIVNHDLN